MTYTEEKTGIWRRAFIAVLLLFSLPVAASAETGQSAAPSVMDLAQLAPGAVIRPDMTLVAGIDRALPPEEVIAQAGQFNFRPMPATGAPQFTPRDGDVWLQFRLTNSSPDISSAKLVLRFPYLEHVDLYDVRADGSIHHSTAGSAIPVTGDGVAAAYPAFQLNVMPGQSRDYFVRVHSSTIIVLPVTIASEAAFSRRTTMETLLWSVIAGAAIAFAIYAASMSFTASNGAFRLYVCFALSAAVYILLSSGLLNALVGMHMSFNFTRLVFFAQAMVMAFGTMLLMAYLDMQRQAPRLFRVFYVFAFIGVLTGVGFLLPGWLARILFFVATGIGPIIIVGGLALMARTGIAGARSIFVAWFPCLLATVWIYLRVLDLTPYVPINHFLLPLAFAFTLAYLSAVFGGRMRQTEFWANTDPLTGLGNRRLLDQLCELESRQPGERYGAAVAIDLDKFKPVNDTFGHAAGDALLIAVAEKMRTHFSGRGDIFRVGGDEFLILGYHWQSRMDIITQANAFLQANLVPVRHEESVLTVGASIGIAFYDHNTGFATMLRQADAELYHVKSSGNGGIRIADQRKRDRRKSEPVLLADNDETHEHISKMFGSGGGK